MKRVMAVTTKIMDNGYEVTGFTPRMTIKEQLTITAKRILSSVQTAIVEIRNRFTIVTFKGGYHVKR